jgi:hypothetical protein
LVVKTKEQAGYGWQLWKAPFFSRSLYLRRVEARRAGWAGRAGQAGEKEDVGEGDGRPKV